MNIVAHEDDYLLFLSPENLKLKSSPYRGPPRTPASRLVPPPHAAHARPYVSMTV